VLPYILQRRGEDAAVVRNSNSNQRGQLWAGVCVCVCVLHKRATACVPAELGLWLAESRCGLFSSVVTAEQDHSDICTKPTWQGEGGGERERVREWERESAQGFCSLSRSSLPLSLSLYLYRNKEDCLLYALWTEQNQIRTAAAWEIFLLLIWFSSNTNKYSLIIYFMWFQVNLGYCQSYSFSKRWKWMKTRDSWG